MRIRSFVTFGITLAVVFHSMGGFRSPVAFTSPASQAAQMKTYSNDLSGQASSAYLDNSSLPPLVVESASALNVFPAFAVYSYGSGEGMVYIPDTAVPGTWDYIKSVPSGNVYYAGDFMAGDYGQLYVLDYDKNELHTLDTTTVTYTLIGPSTPVSGQGWTGMTGAADGTMYASSTDETVSYLYTIDTATGTATAVGEITNAPCIIDIAINTDGEMYGLDICSDVLVQIDPSTGAGTVIGSVGFDANYAQGMDFQASGVLYLAAYNDTASRGELRVADTTTGDSTLVGAFHDDDEVVVLAFAKPTSQPVQLVQNPGFEDGWAHWQTQGYPLLSGTSHSGAASAYFYGEKVSAWQVVYIPADATYATMSYWITGLSSETDFDSDLLCWSLWDLTWQTKYVGNHCMGLAYFNSNPMEWRNSTRSLEADELASIAGQVVLLVFEQTQEWGQYAQTSHAYVDDIVLSVNLPPSPLVTSVTPSSGFNTGIVHVTDLAGDFFQAGASVQLTRSGQTPVNATNVAVVGATRITCDLDLTGAATGEWDVVVTNSDAQSGTLPNGFTVTDPFPTVTSITPSSGVNAGVVHITSLAGANFQTGASVELTQSGQTPIAATNVTVVNESRITCDLDLTGAATGEWDVVVTNPDAQSGTLPSGFLISDKIWDGSLSSDWHTAANWTPSGVPTAGDDVLILDVTNDPVISNGEAAVNSLTIDARAVLDLTDRRLSVEGTLTNNGTLRQTLDVVMGSTTDFVRVTNLAGDQTKYYGLDITPSQIVSLTSGISQSAGEFPSPVVTPPPVERSDMVPVTGASAVADSGIARTPALPGSKGEPVAPLLLLPSGATAFAMEVMNDDLVSFDTDAPATLNVIGGVGANYFGGDFLDGDFSKMYAVDYIANNFVSIDTTTAAVTVIGASSPVTDHIWSGMAGDPTDGTLYGSSTNESASTLYTFTVATGAPIVVGNVTNAPGLIGIAINAAGEMYGLDITNDALVRIDKTTGAGTVVGPVGFSADYAQGMDFDETADILYLAAYNDSTGAAELRIADTITGGTTLVGSFPASTEIDALAIATGGNTPPVAVDDTYTTTQDIPLSVDAPGVLGNDIDGNPLTALLDAGPASGALSLSADGSFSYTPTASFSGVVSFTYHTNDGTSDSNSATVTINVTTVSTPPTLAGLPDQTVPENGSSDNAIDLWSYANDAEDADAALDFVIVNSPVVSAGIAIDSNRYIDINPATGWTGVTDVEVQVQDTYGMTDTDSFRVTVVSGSDIISVTVSVSGNQFCAGRFTGVKRCFDIAPAAALTATVQFYFGEAERNRQVLDDLVVHHYDGDWTEEPGPYARGGTGDAQYVHVQNVGGFSLFALDRVGGGTGIAFLPVVLRQ